MISFALAVAAALTAAPKPVFVMSPETRYICDRIPEAIQGPAVDGNWLGRRGMMYLHDNSTGKDVNVIYQWTGKDWLIFGFANE